MSETLGAFTLFGVKGMKLKFYAFVWKYGSGP